jgi:peroxiredoxin
MKKSYIVVAVVALVFAGLGVYMGQRRSEPATAEAAPASANMPAAQQLLALSLADSHGQKQALSQWKGKFLIVNFWATWCAPCVQEMPELSSLQGELTGKNIQLLGLGIDSPSNISEFADKYKISYPLLAAGMEGSELSRQLGNDKGGLPFTVLISADGKIAKTYVGRLKMDELRADISKLTM